MTTTHILALVIPGLILLLSAALEVAYRAASRFDIHRWAQRGADNGDWPSKEYLDITSTSIRLARQMSLVALIVVVTVVGNGLWVDASSGAQQLIALSGLGFAAYLLVDKVLAFTLVVALGPIRVLTFGRPLIAVFRLVLGGPARLINRFQRDSRARDEPEEDAKEDRDLDAFLDMAGEEGLMSEDDEALLRGVAEFGEVLVDHVMTPRVDIVSIPQTATMRELRSLVAEHKLSRIPVVRDDIDRVVGIVNVRELVAALENEELDAPMQSIVRPALFVPESKKISELLREFQSKREHLAIVVDEYGGTAGLATIEDLLEEIVGEIQDETDDDEQTIMQLRDGVLVAAGKAEIQQIEQLLDVDIAADEFETIGGMTFQHFGYVPKPGEKFDRDGLRVEVLDADDRHVHRVRVTTIEAAAE